MIQIGDKNLNSIDGMGGKKIALRWKIAVFIFLFGIVSIDIYSLKWAVCGLLIYSMPFIFQFCRSDYLRYWSLWIGIFFLVQTCLSPIITDKDFNTLYPNLNMIIDVVDGLPGIHGRQLIKTDKKGFRVTKKVDYSSTYDYKIFTVGGSTTEQIALDNEKTFTHLLQEKLTLSINKEVFVINTGLSGLRAKNHLSTLKEIVRYHPDKVLFLIGINDWNRHIKEHFRSSKREFIEKFKKGRSVALLKNTLFGNAIKSIKFTHGKENQGKPKVKKEYGEYYSKQRGSLDRKQKYTFRPESVDPRYKKTVGKISSVCIENKIDCIFITQPSGYQIGVSEEFKSGFWMTPPNEEYTLDFDSLVHIASLYNNFLIDFARKRGHKICDLAHEFKPSYQIFYDDCHFNENGAENVANYLFSCITSGRN